ncbi:MAG: hypothetical protein GTO03_09145 [Planctomycetales bacterium]|nr:hypothetical protein [Planctomycetales bacterium]
MGVASDGLPNPRVHLGAGRIWGESFQAPLGGGQPAQRGFVGGVQLQRLLEDLFCRRRLEIRKLQVRPQVEGIQQVGIDGQGPVQ